MFLISSYAGASLPTAVFEHDAGLIASFMGGGAQTWANIVSAPADGSAQSDYDFYLGATSGSTTSDPTFNGSAGSDSSAEFFSGDGGDYFTLASGTNTTFLNSLHKDNAIFTWYGFIKTPTSVTGDNALFGNSEHTGTRQGITIYLADDGAPVSFVFAIDRATSQQAVFTAVDVLANASLYFLALSYTESTGAGLFYMRNSAGTKTATSFTQTYTSPSASNASFVSQIWASGNGFTKQESGCKMWRTGMFNIALTEAQLDALYNQYSYKLA